MAINTSNNKVRIISTTVSGLSTNSKFSDIKSPALVVNTSDGGVFYADGAGGTSLKQLAALPNHTHSGYATTTQLGNYLPKSGGALSGNLYIDGDWTTDVGLYFREGADDKYGFNFTYGDGDYFRLNTCSDSTTNTEVFKVYRGSTSVIFASTPYVGTTKVSLEGHTHSDYLPKSGGTLTSAGVTTLNLVDTARNESGISYAGNGGAMWIAGKGVGLSGGGEHFGFYNGTKGLVANLDINGNLTATKFIGPLQGNADSATYATTSTFLETRHYDGDINANNLYYGNSFVLRLSGSNANLPSNMSYGNILYIGGQDTGFMLAGSYSHDKLLFRRGTNANAPAQSIITNAWKTIAFTSDIPTKVSQLTNDSGYTTATGHTHSGYATTAQLANYLPKTGGQLATTSSTILSLNNTNSTKNEVGLRLDMNGSAKGWVGYTSNTGTHLYTYAGLHKLGIKEDGTGFIDGNTIIHSGNIGQQTVASATKLGSYTIDSFMTFSNDTNYVAARFQNSNLAQLAVDTYIEFWSSPGWFNSAWGKVTAHGGFIGNLTGNVTGNVSGSAGSVAWGNVTNKPEIYTKSSVGTFDWPSSMGKLINVDAVAHWNGAYQSTSSNLQYCDRGRFGTIVTKNTGDYATAGHTHSYFPLAGGTVTGNYIGITNSTGAYLSLYNNIILANTGGLLPAYGIAFSKTSNTGHGTHGDVTGDWATYFTMDGDTNRGWIFKHYHGNVASISCNGKFTGANFITTSDKRLKTNIKPLPTNSKSLELNFYEFDYKNMAGHSAGHIAQEVKEVYPELVHGNESETEHLSIDYTGLHSIQIKALLDRIIKLEEEIKILKSSK